MSVGSDAQLVQGEGFSHLPYMIHKLMSGNKVSETVKYWSFISQSHEDSHEFELCEESKVKLFPKTSLCLIRIDRYKRPIFAFSMIYFHLHDLLTGI